VPNKPAARALRTCRFCEIEKVLRSIIARRQHELAEHRNHMTPDQREAVEPYVAEAAFLIAINTMTRTAVVGPGSAALAGELQLQQRSVLKRLRRLKKRGYIRQDPLTETYLLTEAGLKRALDKTT
jgi:hypothetical protein